MTNTDKNDFNATIGNTVLSAADVRWLPRYLEIIKKDF